MRNYSAESEGVQGMSASWDDPPNLREEGKKSDVQDSFYDL